MPKRNVAVIGAGLQARRRAAPVKDDPGYTIARVVARTMASAEVLAREVGATPSADWREAVTDPTIDVVLVLTPPDTHAEIATTALLAGKHVLCEKPLTRTTDEARQLLEVAARAGRLLKCGFNHRFHPAVAEAHARLRAGAIGKPLFVRSRYGFGGRPGLEREWRADPSQSAGGHFMEQGIHLVDLCRWFLGELVEVVGMVATQHWPIAPFEDNGFGLFKSESGAIASLHSSLTQWTNLFEFEIYGQTGSLTISGFGASYGVETLTEAAHDPTGPFARRTIEYRGGDVSWAREWKNFTQAIEGHGELSGDGVDGLRAMEAVLALYEASRARQAVTLANR